jgi:hypothetical protein
MRTTANQVIIVDIQLSEVCATATGQEYIPSEPKQYRNEIFEVPVRN